LLALEQLDQFLDSFQFFSSVGEAAIWAEFRSLRDRCYLFLYIKKQLSNEKINTWLDEKPKFFQAFYQGIISERKLHWEPLAQDLLKGNKDPFDFKHDLYKGLAVILQALHCKERVFAKINSPVEMVEVKKLLKEGGLFSERYTFCMAEHEDVLEIMALEARHRMARLLVKTAQLSGQLPNHEEELRELLGPYAKMLDASDSELPIRYEKVHNDRIRFYIPDDLGLLNVLKDRERSGKQRPKGSDNSPLPLQDWAYELKVKFE
jgi:hypothetical protein